MVTDKTNLRGFMKNEWRECTGWRGLDAESAIRAFVQEYEEAHHKTLTVPCCGGELVAEFFGDAGEFDGIAIDFRKPNGESTQCCIVETDKAMNGELHVLVWDGNDENPASKQVIDKDGEYVY